MQPQNSLSVLDSLKYFFKKTFLFSDNSLVKNSFQKWLQRLTIRQKISYGYALAIGIAILGTTSGRFIENFYEHQAMIQLDRSHEATKILNQLQAVILHVKTHEQNLMVSGKDVNKIKQEYFQLLEAVNEMDGLINDADYMIDNHYSTLQNSYHQNNHKNFKNFMHKYKIILKNYSQNLKLVLKKINPENLQEFQLQPSQKLIRDFTRSQEALSLNELSQKLSDLVESFYEETEEEFKDYREAEMLGTQILWGSLLVSAATAVALAIYTSRAIARPLEATTKIAQQVTEEANFNLQAPVTTQDEVGVLTASLNQLIQRVATYTQELKQTQAQLIQTEKMSSLGQMVAGIAHEINNPVTFIYSNLEYTEAYMQDLLKLTQLYRQKYPETDAEIQEHIEAIDLEFLRNDLPKTLASMKNGAERIRQIVLSLRNFSRLDESEVKAVDLHEGLDSTLTLLNHRIENQIKLVKQYDRLPLIKCYPAEINQVFMNILNNAIDALLEQGDRADRQIEICTEVAVSLETDANWPLNGISHSSVSIRIRDNGPGIPLEIQDKIFDPFFTTKPVGSGTGLGLSICYQILEKHGGKISVNSQSGEGTEFAIALPIQPDKG